MTDLIIKSLGMYGLVIVISMLAALLIKVIVVVIAKSEDSRGRKQARIEAARVPEPILTGEVDPRHVAAISAAVFAVLGSHRIVHIAGSRNLPSWAAEGKRALQSSHYVRRS